MMIVAPTYYAHRQSPFGFVEPIIELSDDKTLLIKKCVVPIGPGYVVVAYQVSDKVFIDAVFAQEAKSQHQRYKDRYFYADPSITLDVEPFIAVEVVGQAYTRNINIENRRVWRSHLGSYAMTEALATYNNSWVYEKHRLVDVPGIPYQHLKVKVTMLDGSAEELIELRFMRPDVGQATLTPKSADAQMHVDFFGASWTWDVNLLLHPAFHHALNNYEVSGGRDALWSWWLDAREVDPDNRDLAGVKAIENRKDVRPNLDRLAQEEPLLWRFFAFLHNSKTRDKTTNNKLLATMLNKLGADYDALRAELRRVLDLTPTLDCEDEYEYGNSFDPIGRSYCLAFVGASDKVAEAKAKAQWQYAKGARAKAEVLGISATRHPLLMARVEAGDVSLNLFHEAGADDNLVNVEFDLWERSLAREGWADVLVEIAQNASARTTYSKRVTSYLAFLFRIERYLDRHAPRPDGSSWRATPRFVQSQWELEMDEATEEGTTKRRSAFTPVADNDTGVVTVPYVAMAVSGMYTTWCYSETYFVAEEGAEDPVFSLGGCYEFDLVEKLNGRDDYGLCLFTLTGTDRNTGYPTFLIIFERTTTHGTRVHFHRVHPSRRRGPTGTETPPSRLVEECYRYMAGNVRAEEILHQQGDILLLKADGPGKSVDDPAGLPVRGFENHAFVALDRGGIASPVHLVRSTAKARDNLLGWLHAPTGMRMPHPEHEPVEGVAPGWYEVRRCKSFEANPVAVWSLNID